MNSKVSKLLRWYRRYGRDLPWRGLEKRPLMVRTYRVLVSEFMLQQTQVERVIPKYTDWLKRFPNWKSLAQANTAALIHAWAGLGYNRRVLALRDVARSVVERGLPADEQGWRALKGIGPYTAAALTEFALQKRAIVIDTNVRRVVGRAFLGTPYPTPDSDIAVRGVLETVTPTHGRHWDLPQAFMDLGSNICRSSNPSCTLCPLKETCLAASLFIRGVAGPKPSINPRERRHRDKKHPDRIYRGKILKHVRIHGPQSLSSLGPCVDEGFSPSKDRPWLQSMVSRLVKDGLLALDKGEIVSLPST